MARQKKEIRQDEPREALASLQDVFQSVVENSRDMIGIFSPSGRLVYLNNQARSCMGVNLKSDVTHHVVSDFLPKTVAKQVVAVVNESLEKQGLWKGESKLKPLHSNKLIPVSLMVTQESSETISSAPRTVCVFRNLQTSVDTTKQNVIETALRNSEQHLRTLLDLVPMMIFAKNSSGRLLIVNQAMATVYGMLPENLLGVRFDEIHPSKGEAQLSMEMDCSVIEHQISLTMEKEKFTFPDGQVHTLHTTKIPFVYNGELASLSVCRDITKQLKLEAELNHSEKMKAVGRLASGVAHDFNNLLTSITGNISLAMMDLGENDPLLELLKEINLASGRATNLTRQLLTFSRKQVIEPMLVDLNQLIRELKKMLHSLISEHIVLDIQLDPTVGLVFVDSGQMEQVIVNMVINAQDAMSNGGDLLITTGEKKLSAAFGLKHPHVKPGVHVVLSISDTGTGIEPDVMKDVFEPFFTTKSEGHGTGLGLATSYGAIQQHGGHIDVQSVPGEGTRFDIYLPKTTKKLKTVSTQWKPDVFPKGTETILLVEDEKMVLEIASRILTRQGYVVYQAMNQKQAYEIIHQYNEKIDLLFSDIIMPGGSGVELAMDLTMQFSHLKVLLSSGYSEKGKNKEVFDEKGFYFIAKPYSPLDLTEKVRLILDT